MSRAVKTSFLYKKKEKKKKRKEKEEAYLQRNSGIMDP